MAVTLFCATCISSEYNCLCFVVDIEQRKVARRNRMIQDKLDEINGRVETTLGNYEAAGAEEMGGAQFVKDMQELMEVATDAVKKRKVNHPN